VGDFGDIGDFMFFYVFLYLIMSN